MKKGFLFLMFFLSFGVLIQAQTMNKQEAREVTVEINKNIEKLEKAVEKANWKKIQKVVDRTAEDINKNADQVIEVIEEIDFSRLVGTIKKVVTEIEENIDIKQLQEAVEEIGVQIDEVFTQKKYEEVK